MADIVIHHCTLRLVRRGGWSWGPNPAGLAEGAVGLISRLLLEKFSDFWPEEQDLEIAAPLRVTLSVRPDELLVARPRQLAGRPSPVTAMEERVARAAKDALAPFLAPVPETERALAPEPEADHLESRAQPFPDNPMLRVLFAWREQGILASCLASFTPAAVAAWHRLLLTATEKPPSRAEAPPLGELADLMLTLARGEANKTLPHPARLRLRIILTLEAAARFGISPGHPLLQETLDRVTPIDAAKTTAIAKTAAAGAFEPSVTASGIPPPAAFPEYHDVAARGHAHGTPVLAALAAPYPSWREGEVYVSSALPFLLLGPLQRLGYFDVLAACLEAAGMSQEAHKFALALAHKVLQPPERDWRRRPEDQAAAAAFAGLLEPMAESELVDFARRFSPFLSPLESILRESLLAGHHPRQPLLLKRPDQETGGGFLLVEVEGIFPIAWAADLKSLLPTLSRFGADPLLIPQNSLEADSLEVLQAAGFHFITDAPPVRRESWRPLRGASTARFWSNDWQSPETRLLDLANSLPEAAEETDTVWRALMVQRPGVARASDRTLDRSLTLAAAAALGFIAWTLWREREPAAPYLTLDRFHDLDARVSFDQHSVKVRLPLGRRYRDLLEHRFLDDTSGIPWFSRRVLRFSGG